MRSRTTTLRRAAVTAALLALAACGDGSSEVGAGGDGSPSPPGSTSTAPTTTLWMAGIAFADDPNELDTLTQELLAAVDTATITGPVDCYEGIPAEAVEGSYVAGVSAASEEELAVVIEAAGHEPLFESEVNVVCG